MSDTDKNSLTVSAGAGEKPLLSWPNVEILFNTVNHGLIAIGTFYITWYCIQSGFSIHTSLHAILSTIGYQILMSEGILMLYKQNSYTIHVESQEKRKHFHWVFLAAGSLTALAGTLVEYFWREMNNRGHGYDHHRHCVWGNCPTLVEKEAKLKNYSQAWCP